MKKESEMKTQFLPLGGRTKRRIICASITAAILAVVLLALDARAQVPPSGVLVGPTLTASLRNAATATRDQALAVRRTANTWSRNANSATYRVDLLMTDFHTAQLQFHALRERFIWTGNLALQANRPYAANVLAELEASLNIIEELLFFLDQHIRDGTLDRATLVRVCQTLESAMRQWEQEFKRGTSRMGVLF